MRLASGMGAAHSSAVFESQAQVLQPQLQGESGPGRNCSSAIMRP